MSTAEDAARIVERLEVGAAVDVAYLRDGESHSTVVEPDIALADPVAGRRFELPFEFGDGRFAGNGLEALLERFAPLFQEFGDRFGDFGAEIGAEFGSIQIVRGELIRVDDERLVVETASGTVEFTIDDNTLIPGGAEALTPGQEVFVVAADGVARIVRQPLGSPEPEAVFTG